MLIVCQNCETRFRFDENLLPPEGARVRCSRCQHRFHVAPPSDAPPPAAESDGTDPGSPDPGTPAPPGDTERPPAETAFEERRPEDSPRVGGPRAVATDDEGDLENPEFLYDARRDAADSHEEDPPMLGETSDSGLDGAFPPVGGETDDLPSTPMLEPNGLEIGIPDSDTGPPPMDAAGDEDPALEIGSAADPTAGAPLTGGASTPEVDPEPTDPFAGLSAEEIEQAAEFDSAELVPGLEPSPSPEERPVDALAESPSFSEARLDAAPAADDVWAGEGTLDDDSELDLSPVGDMIEVLPPSVHDVPPLASPIRRSSARKRTQSDGRLLAVGGVVLSLLLSVVGIRALTSAGFHGVANHPPVDTGTWTAHDIQAFHVRDASGARVLVVRGQLEGPDGSGRPRVQLELRDGDGERVSARSWAHLAYLPDSALAPDALRARLAGRSRGSAGSRDGFTILVRDPPDAARSYSVRLDD